MNTLRICRPAWPVNSPAPSSVAPASWSAAHRCRFVRRCKHQCQPSARNVWTSSAIKVSFFPIWALLAFFTGIASAADVKNFDAHWHFTKGDVSGAEQPGYDDSTWRVVDLPHDWSIEGPFAATNLTGGAGAFLPSGVAWYRKEFSLATRDQGKLVAVEFDGVMQNSDVWINGHLLGHRPSGYVGFRYDLPENFLHYGDGATNTLALRCDTSAQPASRWYSGAGIYRHVRLVMANPVHIEPGSVFIYSTNISASQVILTVQAVVKNDSTNSELTMQTTIIGPDGKMIEPAANDNTFAPHATTTTVLATYINNPQRWDLEHPNLYRAVTRVLSHGKELDSVTNIFGIRDAHFEADTGFWLNGKNFKIKGVCLHQDGGAFGVAVPMAVWETRLRTLKSLGVNAIRTAHNPPAPEFLDLCDQLGFLVMDEMFDCWTVGKNKYDYHLYFDDWSQIDERDAILRDRNHPSVILYSVGNEIHDTPQAEKAKTILAGLVQVAHLADPTRPVTQALFRPNVSHDYDDGLADLLDVVGQNYRPNEIIAAHEQKPARKIIGTENVHDRVQWTPVRDNAAYSGEFLWTGIDYLGESRRWPMIGHGSGLLDRTGAIRPLARERQSWWSDQPMVAIARRLASTDSMPTDPGYGAEERHTQVLFSDWTPANTNAHTENVEVYSNCKQVELFLNGQSLGSQIIHGDASSRSWQVPYTPGTLLAVGSDDGAAVATNELRAAGAPARILLTASNDRLTTDWNSAAEIRAKIVDKDGIEIPRANDLITFNITGPGVVAAVDNGDNASHESFQTNVRHAFQGECVAYVKATGTHGKVTVTASAPGLTDGSITIKTAK